MLNSRKDKADFPVCVGVICSANGIKGHVKIKSFTENQEDILAFHRLYDPISGRVFKLSVVSSRKDALIAKIEGVTDRNEAETLHNTKLYIDRSELPEIPENEFYHTDLIGLLVEDSMGVQLGKITNVMNFGAGDIMEIRNESTNKEEYYPFNKDFVIDVKLQNGIVVVNRMEELVTSQD